MEFYSRGLVALLFLLSIMKFFLAKYYLAHWHNILIGGNKYLIFVVNVSKLANLKLKTWL